MPRERGPSKSPRSSVALITSAPRPFRLLYSFLSSLPATTRPSRAPDRPQGRIYSRFSTGPFSLLPRACFSCFLSIFLFCCSVSFPLFCCIGVFLVVFYIFFFVFFFLSFIFSARVFYFLYIYIFFLAGLASFAHSPVSFFFFFNTLHVFSFCFFIYPVFFSFSFFLFFLYIFGASEDGSEKNLHFFW